VVWDSLADYGGAGWDSDIFWSAREGGSWATAQPVNDWAATDSGSYDFLPSLDVAPDGEVYAVWVSTHDPGAVGSDTDLFMATMDAPGGDKAAGVWQPGILLLEHFETDSGLDEVPEISVSQEVINVVWASSDGLAFDAAGSDFDIFHVQVPRTSPLPSDAPVAVANANAFADLGRDWLPALAVLPAGTVVMAWQCEDDLGGRIGIDQDIVLGRMGEAEGIFVDGFEMGSTSVWTNVVGD
jgi:hypothetical protein